MIIQGRSYRDKLPALTDAERSSFDRMKLDVDFLAGTLLERNSVWPENLAKAEEFITSRFRELGFDIRMETYLADGEKVSNIEASLTGHDKPD